MKKMNPLPMLSSTIPVGKECSFPSWVEAYDFVVSNHYQGNNLSLMFFHNDEEDCIMWCSYDSKHTVLAAFPLFLEHSLSQGGLMKGHVIQTGEYFIYRNHLYKLCEDAELVQVVRQINVFASTDDAKAAYFLSNIGTLDKTPESQPDCSLVRLINIEKPRETLCISWLLKKDNIIFFQPVFEDDYSIYRSCNINDLNWEFLHAGHIFLHGKNSYQICLDDKDRYYISLLPFQIIKSNSPE